MLDRALGSRGSRSDRPAARPVPALAEPAPDPAIAAPPAVAERPPGARPGSPPALLAVGVLVGTMIGAALLARRVFGRADVGLLDLLFLAGSAVALVVMYLRHRRAAAAAAASAAAGAARRLEAAVTPAPKPTPPADPSLDRGLRDIQRADRGFDPARFTGYAAMAFRDVQGAWTRGDLESLRDRVTAEVHAELQARFARSRRARHVNRVEEIDVRAQVTEAWQEEGRDYVTAAIGGSMVDYTVDEASDDLVDGSRTTPRPVEEFWTFTRLAGLNFWMLSAIQTA